MAASRQPRSAVALTPAEEELRVMWQEAELEFSQLTGRSLSANREKRLDDVLNELEQKYDPPAESKDSRAKARLKIRTTVKQVLSCIQILGGLAAQGASIVFGPATLCFNAISFLIDVPNKIASVYEGVGNLFEEVSHFLALSKIYEDYTTLDPGLKAGTHKLMVSMVRICALSIKIIDGGFLHQIKISAKVTFLNDDSGVRTELNNFRALIERQSHITEAVTLKYALSSDGKLGEVLKAQYESGAKLSSIQEDMTLVAADVKDRKQQMIFSDQVEQIANMLTMTKEAAEGARKSIQSLQGNVLPGSGQWLLAHDDYKEWKNSKSDSVPLLLLSGEEKTGKSCLLSVIEADLRGGKAGTAIAYYEFRGRDAKTSKDRHNEEVISALKSIALQLAGQLKSYAREIAALRDEFQPPEGKDKESLEKLWWDKLRFSKYAQSKEELNCVLIFDGLGELADSNQDKFTKLVKLVRDEQRSFTSTKLVRPHLRIVATGTRKTFENIRPASIDVASSNRADIVLYIEEELRNTEVLQGQHVEMQDLLQAIQQTLPDVADGSFSVVQQKLERIRKAVDSDAYLDDVVDILHENPADDVGKLAKDILSKVNATLNAHETKELSEILHWCIFGAMFFTIDEIRATVFLSTGRVSLQPFERKLRKKYSKVLRIDENFVFVEDAINDTFRSREGAVSTKATRYDLDSARISMTISVEQADTPSIQQFFWDLTERTGIGKFDFLHNLENNTKGTVETDKVRAEYHITEQILKLLNDEPHEKTRCLVSYALAQFPAHLQQVYESLEADNLGDVERKTIAKGLVDLLSDVDGVERFLSTNDGLPIHWLDVANVKTVRSWLMDPKTADVLQPKERRWAKLHTEGTAGRTGVYKPLTLMVARQWLRDQAWEASGAWTWVRRFVALQNLKEELESEVAPDGDAAADTSEHDKDQPDFVPASESTTSIEEDILSDAKWTQEALSLTEASLDSLWYERLAETCYQFREFGPAKSFYEKAKAFSGYRWTVNQGWAMAVHDMADAESGPENKKELKAQACEEIRTVLQHLRSLAGTTDEWTGNRSALVKNLKRLATWEGELGFVDQAFALYEEAIVVDPGEHDTRSELLKALYTQKKEVEAKNMLLDMMSQTDESTGLNLFGGLLRFMAEETSTYTVGPLEIMIFLGQEDRTYKEQLLESLQTVISEVRRNALPIKEGVLLLHQGVALARGISDESRLQRAVQCWDQIQDLDLPSRYDLWAQRRLAARYAAQHYFQQALNPEIAAEEREEHAKQLERSNRQSLGVFRPTSYLAAYYVQKGQSQEARKLYRRDMDTAFEIFYDDDPDNDLDGYKTLASILMYAGDDLNALSAWSLLGPTDLFKAKAEETVLPSSGEDDLAENHEEATNAVNEDKTIQVNGVSEPAEKDGAEVAAVTTNRTTDVAYRDGPLWFNCDGRCDHSWNYADDMYVCRYCDDTQFNEICWKKVKENKLERYICHPGHSWLHVPPWRDEDALEVGKGKVRVGGELVNGKRVGGEVVDISEWLDGIRVTWELPKREPVVELDAPLKPSQSRGG